MTGAVRDSVEARTDAHPLSRRNAFGIFVCLRFSYFDDQVSFLCFSSTYRELTSQ